SAFSPEGARSPGTARTFGAGNPEGRCGSRLPQTAGLRTLRRRADRLDRPAAPEGLVDGDEADRDVPFAVHELVFRGVDGALGIEHGKEVLEAAGVPLGGEVERA